MHGGGGLTPTAVFGTNPGSPPGIPDRSRGSRGRSRGARGRSRGPRERSRGPLDRSRGPRDRPGDLGTLPKQCVPCVGTPKEIDIGALQRGDKLDKTTRQVLLEKGYPACAGFVYKEKVRDLLLTEKQNAALGIQQQMSQPETVGGSGLAPVT
jgi:hypothetical protein